MPTPIIPKILKSTAVALNVVSYTKSTMYAEGTLLDNLTFYMSADGGTNWEKITATVNTAKTVATFPELSFANTSTAGIKYTIVGTNATLTKLTITYE